MKRCIYIHTLMWSHVIKIRIYRQTYIKRKLRKAPQDSPNQTELQHLPLPRATSEYKFISCAHKLFRSKHSTLAQEKHERKGGGVKGATNVSIFLANHHERHTKATTTATAKANAAFWILTVQQQDQSQ
jgi:hypothetical protein